MYTHKAQNLDGEVDGTQKGNVRKTDSEQPKGENRLACEVIISLSQEVFKSWLNNGLGGPILEETHVSDRSLKEL